MKHFLLLLLLYVSALAGPEATEPLSPAKEGKFPIQMPAYERVEQLLVLSNEWVIVVTDNLDEVSRKIDELSQGALTKAFADWEASQQPGRNPDWTAYKARGTIRDNYLAQAREACGERRYGDPAFFTITSPDDERYGRGRQPIQAACLPVGLGRSRHRGSPSCHYSLYSYLRFPEPMQNGKHYTVALGNGRRVTWLYDELRTVSRAIKVNQVGYLADAGRKYAYLGAYIFESGPVDFSACKTFRVIAVDSGKEVLTGAVRLREKNPRFAVEPGRQEDPATRPLLNGEDVYELDLSALRDSGWFFISIPGVGRSWPFRHGPDAYGEAFYTAMKGLYHQRCGIAYEPPYTAWKRIKCHTDPVYETQFIFLSWGIPRPGKWERFDIIGADLNPKRAGAAKPKDDLDELLTDPPPPRVKTENVIGGWHDAADWDRNQAHLMVVFDLLNAYELGPAKFTDGQLNIPESGNGIPDLLDEAEWGLKVWTAGMHPDGGVSGAVETWTHPAIDATIDYGFARRTRWASLDYAAAAAQLARLLRASAPAKSREYEALAKQAYAFGSNPKNSLGTVTIHAAADRGAGRGYAVQFVEKEEYSYPYLVHAKLMLYLLTHEKDYLEGVPELAAKVSKYIVFHQAAWMMFAVARDGAGILPDETVKIWRGYFLERADDQLSLIDQMPYRRSWLRWKTEHLSWGESVATNRARNLLIGYALTGDRKYRDGAILNADYMLGANALGISWTTGLGYTYPVHIQHAVSIDDGIDDPVPGITIYGLTGFSWYVVRNEVWRSPKAAGSKESVVFAKSDVPVFRRFTPHETNTASCEFTIHETMGATALVSAMLLNEGWQAPAELRQRRPRQPQYLFGNWMLP